MPTVIGTISNMIYKGPSPKCGITINGTDLLDLDPNQVHEWIAQQPKGTRSILHAIIRGKMIPDDLPADYAKEYGRPSLTDRPYMTCENDGYPYLGNGHSPQCNGKLTYSSRASGYR